MMCKDSKLCCSAKPSAFSCTAHEVGAGDIAKIMSGRAVVLPRFDCGQYLGNHWPDCFHIAYTHRLGGVDVPSEGDDLWPSIFRRSFNLIDDR